MKKNTMLIFIIMLIIISTPFVYKRIKVRNVYDEIYYDSSKASDRGPSKRSSFGKVEGVSQKPMFLPQFSEIAKGEIIRELYMDEYLIKPIQNLSITANNGSKELTISFSVLVSEDMLIVFMNDYDVKTKKIVKKIYFYDKLNSTILDGQEDVSLLLKEFEISESQLNEWYKKGITDQVLKDWFSVYKSRFSNDNLGSYEIESNWISQ